MLRISLQSHNFTMLTCWCAVVAVANGKRMWAGCLLRDVWWLYFLPTVEFILSISLPSIRNRLRDIHTILYISVGSSICVDAFFLSIIWILLKINECSCIVAPLLPRNQIFWVLFFPSIRCYFYRVGDWAFKTYLLASWLISLMVIQFLHENLLF